MLTLTDMDNDCLEEIFKYLSIDDLLNVVDANKLLRIAAGSLYRRKFGRKPVTLSKMKPNQTTLIGTLYQVEVTGLKKCLQFVRCFGSFISVLCIDYNQAARKDYIYLNRYINQFCTDTLIDANFNYIQKRTNLQSFIKKPFKMVEFLRITASNLGNQLTEIIELFPNVRRLQLHSNQMNGGCIEKNLARLEYMDVEINFGTMDGDGLENIIQAIRLNPQLRRLRIHEKIQFTFGYFVEMVWKSSSITEDAQYHDLAQALPAFPRNSRNIRSSDVIEFIGRVKHLTKFSFYFDKSKDQQFEELKAHLDGEWDCSHWDGHVKLKRRV